MSKRMKGFVKWFSAKKGYGFISVDSQEDIFVHFSNIEISGFRTLDIGDEVEFEIDDTKKGKGPEALKVTIVSKDRRY
jgi:CspA family cold shock protein